MGGWVGGWVDVWMDGWMDGWLDGWMDGWMDRWINEWINGWMGACNITPCQNAVETPLYHRKIQIFDCKPLKQSLFGVFMRSDSNSELGKYFSARNSNVSLEALDKSYASQVDAAVQHIRSMHYLLLHLSIMCKVVGYMLRSM